jgi:hypothetical protein
MFQLFKKKSELEILQKKYEKLMEETFVLSQKDRSAGDRKYAEAEEVLAKIETLKQNEIKNG